MTSTGRGGHQPEQFRSWLSSPVFRHFAVELRAIPIRVYCDTQICVVVRVLALTAEQEVGPIPAKILK